MTEKRIVTLDRLTLRLPRHALGSREAILREVTKALGAHAGGSIDSLTVRPAPTAEGEGPQALSHRVGAATAARLRQGGGGS